MSLAGAGPSLRVVGLAWERDGLRSVPGMVLVGHDSRLSSNLARRQGSR